MFWVSSKRHHKKMKKCSKRRAENWALRIARLEGGRRGTQPGLGEMHSKEEWPLEATWPVEETSTGKAGLITLKEGQENSWPRNRLQTHEAIGACLTKQKPRQGGKHGISPGWRVAVGRS